jgi:hypothetical protein
MKKKVIKDYRNLPEEIREEIRLKYPQGFVNHMITFFDKDKHLVSALPHETEEISYLIKMPSSLHLDEDDDESDESMVGLSVESQFEDLDEEKYLIQEEEEEESD